MLTVRSLKTNLENALVDVWSDLANRGVWPIVAINDLNGLLAVNRAMAPDPANDWYPLLPMYHPHNEPGGETFVITMRGDQGQMAAVVAGRLRDVGASLGHCILDGTFFSAFPLDGMTVSPITTSDGSAIFDRAMFAMAGPVSIVGAGYVHPAFRKNGLLRPMFSAAALLSVLLWPQCQHVVCDTRARDATRMGHLVLGFPRTHGLVEVFDPRCVLPSGAEKIALMSMTRAEVLEDAGRLAPGIPLGPSWQQSFGPAIFDRGDR